MKSKNLITVLSTLALIAAGSAYAGEDYTNSNISKQNLSKRPYQQQVPVESTSNKKDNFEGATLIDENVQTDIMLKHKRLNMLSRRHYIE